MLIPCNLSKQPHAPTAALTWLRKDPNAAVGVFFLHGFAGTVHTWQPVVQNLAIPVQAAAIALPGHHPAVGVQPTFAQNAQLLCEIIEKEQPQYPIVLVGYSLGARLALAMAQQRRLNITQLTLISCHFGLTDQAARQQRLLADAKWVSMLEAQSMESFLQAWEAQPLFAHQAQTPLLQAQRVFRRQHDPRQIACALRHLGLAQMPSYWEQLGVLEHPTQLIVGQRDTKFVQLAQKALTRLPHGQLEIIHNCGHNPVVQAPEILAEKIFQHPINSFNTHKS